MIALSVFFSLVMLLYLQATVTAIIRRREIASYYTVCAGRTLSSVVVPVPVPLIA